MKRMLCLSGLLALGLIMGAPAGADAADGVYYDARGRPFVVSQHGGKKIRLYCRKAYYGQVRCPQVRRQLRYGPYTRDFAVSQGYQIQR